MVTQTLPGVDQTLPWVNQTLPWVTQAIPGVAQMPPGNVWKGLERAKKIIEMSINQVWVVVDKNRLVH